MNRAYSFLSIILLALITLATMTACNPPTTFPMGSPACWQRLPDDAENPVWTCNGVIEATGGQWTQIDATTWEYVTSGVSQSNAFACTSSDGDTVTILDGGVGLDGTKTYLYRYDPACEAASVPPTPPPAPAVWLAGVCETHDGFSDDGWMTISSDTASTLYAGTGPENDWIPVTVPGPNWVLSRQNINDIAAVLQLTDYHNIWFKVGDGGQPAHLRSMIIDRDKLMAGQCAIP